MLAAYEEFKNAGRDGGADWIAVSDRLGGARSALAARTHFVNVLMPKQRLEKQVGQWDPQEVSGEQATQLWCCSGCAAIIYTMY